MKEVYFNKKKKSPKTIILLFILVLILSVIVYFYNSSMFERNPPKIHTNETLFWNFKTPIKIKITDDSGVKEVIAKVKTSTDSTQILSKTFKVPQLETELELTIPQTSAIKNDKKFTLEIKATDNSKWNFLFGNETNVNIPVEVDLKKPNISILNHSYKISTGGVGLVIFKVTDDRLKDVHIKVNNNIYTPTPFYKKGYYIALLAWSVYDSSFAASIVATDEAQNTRVKRISFYNKDKKYKVSKIKINDNFIDGKITDLFDEFNPGMSADNIEKFKFVNETLRIKNEEDIKKITTSVPEDLINSFYVKPFYPLKNAAAVASFGDHRFYSYKGKQISESYHLGLDLASTKEAKITSSNDGVVVYAKNNGIYGNNLIIYHGLGVYSLYGHCTDILVSKGDIIKSGDFIAKTGTSGLALGDHLHFGMIVNGIEVNPSEWMDKTWLKTNIFDIIRNAKKSIGN